MSVINLLQPPAGSLNGGQGVWKRKDSGEDDNENQPEVKKPRTSWYVTLQRESSPDESENDDHESIYSVQGQETEYAQDISGSESFDSNLSDTESFESNISLWIDPSADNNIHVEYDVATEPESDHFFIDTSSSDPEDILISNYLSSWIPSDLEIFGDDIYDTSDSLDSTSMNSYAFLINKYQKCLQCSSTNNNPMYRYCTKCYKLRKSIFPPRPHNKRKKKAKKTDSSDFSSQLSILTSKTDSGLNSGDLTVSSQDQSSQNTEVISVSSLNTDQVDKNTKNIILISNDNTTECQPSTSGTLDCQKKQSNDDNDNDEDDTENKCQACCVNERNGAFHHGTITHICCCYKCSMRVWKDLKYCPLCKRKITYVSKICYG